ncbi:hypothetical protein [Streptomyces virginiae]|uniref:Uncharacterized protein n=1 Tax=Streptomyces virginiae TaxID=1961 RepID=A0ABZ1TE39_STRVG|nr:hypothetical protein [Streptomyces virginiae]
MSEQFEFRLSNDGCRRIAFFDPGNSPWFLPEANMRGRFTEHIDETKWTRYISQEQAADEVLRIVASWYEDVNDGHGLDASDLVTELERAGYPLPDDEAEE